MTIEDILNDARSVVKKVVPDHVEITQVDFEGPTIVIYTKNMEVFAESNDLVRQIAQQLRRRIVVRPDPSLLATPEEAEKVIREVIPPEAQITGIYFETETGEVTIEALSPGMVIGRHGSILNEVKKKIGWAPKVVRTPPIPSKTVEEIRQYLRTINDERQTFLKQVGRRLAREVPAGENYVRITALGGFRQVGRSAALLSTRESKVLIDCGVLISEDNGSPYLNAPEVTPLSSIDAVVITHAHLDHSGLVPALFKYGYEGPIYTTAPTRDLMSLLQLDFIKVAMGEARKSAYDSSHIRKAVANTIPLKYGETTDIAPDIRLTFQNAGHILGSGVAHFHIGDGLYNVAMSGDIKFEKTWLFNPAVNKFPRIETLVLESTYGGYHDIQPSRHEAAQQLKEVTKRVLSRGGKVLVPVFAVGRSRPRVLQGMGRQPAPRPPLRRVPIRRLPGPADPAGGPGDHAHGSRTAPDLADQARPRDDRRLLGPLGPSPTAELRGDDGAEAGAGHRESRRGVQVFRPRVRPVQEVRPRGAGPDEPRDDPAQVRSLRGRSRARRASGMGASRSGKRRPWVHLPVGRSLAGILTRLGDRTGRGRRRPPRSRRILAPARARRPLAKPTALGPAGARGRASRRGCRPRDARGRTADRDHARRGGPWRSVPGLRPALPNRSTRVPPRRSQIPGGLVDNPSPTARIE